jgi:DNA-binding SARP family transcriptional activator/tetratricopeptide (TPR) repeat protein
MNFQLLGPLAVIAEGQELSVGGPRERTVLAMLLLERGRLVPIDRLVDALWGDSPPESARGQVHICVSALRRHFAAAGGQGVIETRRPGYVLRLGRAGCDLDEFIRLTAEARGQAAANHHEAAARLLRAALSLWHGEPLADVHSGLVRSAALGLTELHVSAIEDWLDACLLLGRHDDVCREISVFVTQHPLRERLRKQQVTALYRAGRVADALDACRRARDAFVNELGLEPSPQFQWLERAVLTHDPALGTAEANLPGHAVTAPVLPRQLPPGIGDFTGREELTAQLQANMRPAGPVPRLVVVSGPAGVGKTTLAVHVAHAVRDAFPDGQLFADLHGAQARPVTLAWVLERFLRALGLTGTATPAAVEDRVMLYRSLISGRRLLIVLDDAAAEQQVSELLPTTAGCATIVTSRRRLTGIGGARHVEVGLLDADDASRLLKALAGPSIEAADEAARSLVSLCAGLPLALRIAASRLAARPHWTVKDLLARLDDEPSRLDELMHGELGVRPSIALSYDSLDAAARRLFCLIGLLEVADFPGWVGAPLLDTDSGTAQELLEHLVDARLVEVTAGQEGQPPRYHAHDLLRIYARERLAIEVPATERQAALARFIGCVLHLAEETHRREYGGDHTVLHGPAVRFRLDAQVVALLLERPLHWLERERPVIVSAVNQAARAGLAEYAWDLAITAVDLFELGAYFDDWLQTHEAALAAAEQAGDRRGEAAMHYSLGALFIAQQRLSEAAASLDIAHRIFGEFHDQYAQALVQRNQAFVWRAAGRLDKASDAYLAALDVLQVAGDPVAEAHALSGLAVIHIERGEFAAADKAVARAMRLCRGVSQRMLTQLTYRSGELCLADGDTAGAAARFTTVLAAAGESHDEVGAAYARCGLGVAALAEGRLAEAESYLDAGLTLACRIGDRITQGRLLLALGQTYARSSRATAAATALTRALETFTAQNAVPWAVRTLDALAGVHAQTGDLASAQATVRQALTLLGDLPDTDAAYLIRQLSGRFASSAPVGLGRCAVSHPVS